MLFAWSRVWEEAPVCRSPLHIPAVRLTERLSDKLGYFKGAQMRQQTWKKQRSAKLPRNFSDWQNCLERSFFPLTRKLPWWVEVVEHTLVPALAICHPSEGGLWCWSILRVVDSLVSKPHSYYRKQPQSIIGSPGWGLAMAALCSFFRSLSNFQWLFP